MPGFLKLHIFLLLYRENFIQFHRLSQFLPSAYEFYTSFKTNCNFFLSHRSPQTTTAASFSALVPFPETQNIFGFAFCGIFFLDWLVFKYRCLDQLWWRCDWCLKGWSDIFKGWGFFLKYKYGILSKFCAKFLFKYSEMSMDLYYRLNSSKLS